VTGDDDLVKFDVTLSCLDPVPSSGKAILRRDNTNVKVWNHKEKGSTNAILTQTGELGKVWDLSISSERNDYIAKKGSLWVEGCAVWTSGVSIEYRDSSNTLIGIQERDYSCIAAICGNQPKTTGSPSQRDKFNAFLNLKRCEWSITDSATTSYNCIAFTVNEHVHRYHEVSSVPGTNIIGIDEVYGDPTNGRLEISDMDNFYYLKKGYQPTGTGMNDSTVVYYSQFHAAIKVSSSCNCGGGFWNMFESKCGDSERIEHVDHQLNGVVYGSPIRYYK
jgi:hypothetical protein